jgi:hypothetical protein
MQMMRRTGKVSVVPAIAAVGRSGSEKMWGMIRPVKKGQKPPEKIVDSRKRARQRVFCFGKSPSPRDIIEPPLDIST